MSWEWREECTEWIKIAKDLKRCLADEFVGRKSEPQLAVVYLKKRIIEGHYYTKWTITHSSPVDVEENTDYSSTFRELKDNKLPLRPAKLHQRQHQFYWCKCNPAERTFCAVIGVEATAFSDLFQYRTRRNAETKDNRPLQKFSRCVRLNPYGITLLFLKRIKTCSDWLDYLVLVSC